MGRKPLPAGEKRVRLDTTVSGPTARRMQELVAGVGQLLGVPVKAGLMIDAWVDSATPEGVVETLRKYNDRQADAAGDGQPAGRAGDAN